MIKRSIDIVGSLALLTLTFPVLAGAALAVYLSLGRPILFRQIRPGKNEVPFILIKLRTMREDNGEVSDADRLTPVGRWLRRTSIDELPSLINVLRGDMSLVGPRPLLMKYLPFYTETERLRHSIRPGLTGWAQVHGRNNLDWDKRFQLDIYYVKNRSLALDLNILLRTAGTVLSQRGVVPSSNMTLSDLDVARRERRRRPLLSVDS
ncbi:sugar transferase [Longibacter salinarum]|uniref:Sugar transferase n=1 Tax=Longibacter salinarum TaxID=1850348 RepID=A0A2A8D0Q5_9BACT|nr:sugar transferase [Longibacter salinarum]PEN14505.1 sugar transferase [Longibacter salinarum]